MASASAAAQGIRSSSPSEEGNSRPTLERAIYSNLPTDVQELVFCRLPLSAVFKVPRLSEAWRATFTTPYFKRLLDEAHPKMFAIVGFLHQFRLTVAAFDFASHQWHYRILRNPEYEISWGHTVSYTCFAHDAGLLCFVPPVTTKECPIVVCNPLTEEWKTLPPVESKDYPWNPELVQLEVNVTTRHYRVTVVHWYWDRHVITYAAEVYDSVTNLWSKRQDGVVSGQIILRDGGLLSSHYNCSTGNAFQMPERHIACHWPPNLRPGHGFLFMTAGERDQRYIMLHVEQSRDTYRLSECEVSREDGSAGRMIDSYYTSLQVRSEPCRASLMATERFLLLVADDCKVEGQRRRRQTIHVRDQVAREWHEIPALKEEFSVISMEKYFMCELRWNATP